MECLYCGFVYGANGSDIAERKCQSAKVELGVLGIGLLWFEISGGEHAKISFVSILTLYIAGCSNIGPNIIAYNPTSIPQQHVFKKNYTVGDKKTAYVGEPIVKVRIILLTIIYIAYELKLISRWAENMS